MDISYNFSNLNKGVNPANPPIHTKAKEYRKVSPGFFLLNLKASSQKDYVMPVNTTISGNQYFKRDVRRSYPQTVVISKDSTPTQDSYF